MVFDQARRSWVDQGTVSYTGDTFASNVTFELNWTSSTTSEPIFNTSWDYWNGTGTADYARYGNAWQTTWTPIIGTYSIEMTPMPAVEQLSPEEADRRLRETRERMHRQAIRRKRAVRKGQRLLVSLLSETQKWEYARKGQFTVCGADGEWYVLRKGGTVHQLGKNGVPEWSHCIHLPYSYIEEDSLIAVKLMLETDPANFHRIANTSKLRPSSINVSNLPRPLVERAAALSGGMSTVTEHLRRLSETADRARRSMDRLHRAHQYAGYARELETQVVAEGAGLVLPLNAQQHYVAEALGHDVTIGGEAVLAA